jgi:hypothetical protein
MNHETKGLDFEVPTEKWTQCRLEMGKDGGRLDGFEWMILTCADENQC